MAEKVLYAGTFNLNNEVINETAEAYSTEQAKFFMAQSIALQRGVIPQIVWAYFKKNPLSYKIVQRHSDITKDSRRTPAHAAGKQCAESAGGGKISTEQKI